MTIEFLIELAWKSSVIAAASLGALVLLKHAAPRDRARVATGTVLLLAALPLIVLWLPGLTIETPAPAMRDAPTAAVGTGLVPSAVTALPAASSAPDPDAMVRGLYVLPVTGMLLWLGIGLLNLWYWAAGGSPVRNAAWNNALERSVRSFGLRRRPRLLCAEEASAPISYGLFRPTIIVDRQSIEREEDAEAVIRHEAAHLARFDWPTLLLSRIVRALFWFNPLVWLLIAKLEEQLEEAADELAVEGLKPSAYAQALLNAARAEAASYPANGAAAPSLERRVVKLFSERRSRAGSPIALAIMSLCACIAAPTAALQFVETKAEPVIRSAPVPASTIAPVASIPAPTAAGPVAVAEPRPAEFRQSAGDDITGTARFADLAKRTAETAALRGEMAHEKMERAMQLKEREIENAVAEAARAAAIMETEAERAVELAMREVRVELSRAADEMLRGADEMEGGADEMESEAEKLRSREYREKIIAEHAARGRTVTHEELIGAIEKMQEGAREMRKGAVEMRQGAEEIRSGEL